MFLYYTLFDYTAQMFNSYILEHLSDPTRRGHYVADPCPPFPLPWAFHVVVVYLCVLTLQPCPWQ